MEKEFILTHKALKVSCKLSQPDHGAVQRVVLGVHGIAGSAQDQIQTGIAEEMAMFRSAVLRFDFPAHGESPMPDLTLPGCIESLLAVADHALALFPQVEDLCIFATGFGAFVTLNALDELLELPVKVRLVLHTPSVRMERTLLSMLQITEERFWVLENVTIPTKRPIDLTYRFYQELKGHPALAHYNAPMLILDSESDEYIPMDDIRHFRGINERSKLVIIPGTSHQFVEDGAWDMVLDLTRDWFEFEQVLLTDHI